MKDKRSLLLLLGYAQKHPAIQKICYMTVKLSWGLFFGLYALGGLLLWYQDDLSRIGFYIAVPLICLCTSYAMRGIVKKARPSQKYHFKPAYDMVQKKSYSFPSNHSSSAMVIAFAWGFINPYAGLAAGLLALWTGLSRALLGIHFLSDVAAGWALATVFGVAGFCVLPYLSYL